MKFLVRRRALACAALALAAGSLAPAPAGAALSLPAPLNLAPAASADAYGFDIDAVTAANITVNQGPFGRATQDFPPQAAEPADAQFLGVGPLPNDGSLVQNVGVLTSIAGANGTPAAVATALATDVRLLGQNGAPLITAEVLRAQSNSDCVNDPNGAGTDFFNLRVSGVTDPIPTPAPNTELLAPIFNPLGLRVILNEQMPTADGRGWIVNAIHIYNYAPPLVPPAITLFRGDIIVSHAMTTVNCPNGKTSTGNNNPVFITKNADKAQARPGDLVTYTATVQNKSASACLVNQFIDHLPTAFDFESTSGDFGTSATTVNRMGGGVDAVLKPTNMTIPGGGSATQTFVLKVKPDAAPGIYFNNVEILCGNLGNFVKGLDAPVEITTTIVDPPRKPQCSDGIDNDGDGKIDFPNDPGCDSPLDDDERDRPRSLPRTGGGQSTTILLGALLLGAAVALRRKALV